MTVLHITETDLHIPDFALEPERLWTKLSELTFGKDIDFEGHPDFSRKYYLRSNDEPATRNIFTENLLQFLESHDDTHIESHKNKLLVYRKRDLLDASEITALVRLAEEFVALANQGMQQPA